MNCRAATDFHRFIGGHSLKGVVPGVLALLGNGAGIHLLAGRLLDQLQQPRLPVGHERVKPVGA
jgi:hypothetical protein